MKCSPVVNGCSTGLCRYIGIFPDTFTLGAAHGLIFALADKRKAFAPLLADQVLNGVKFTGLTTPPGIYCRRTMAVEQLLESGLPICPHHINPIVLRNCIDILIGFRKLKSGIREKKRGLTECFGNDKERGEAVLPTGI